MVLIRGGRRGKRPRRSHGLGLDSPGAAGRLFLKNAGEARSLKASSLARGIVTVWPRRLLQGAREAARRVEPGPAHAGRALDQRTLFPKDFSGRAGFSKR